MLDDNRFVRELVLSVISDDYESLEIIVDSIRRLPGPLAIQPNESHIQRALAELVKEGLAAAYLLSPQPPHVTPATFFGRIDR
jgi:hypothetical protein